MNKTTAKFAFAGVRLAATGTLAQAWEPVDDGESILIKSLVSSPSIGAIYEVTRADEDRRFYTGGKDAPKRVMGAWASQDDRLVWSALDAEARLAHEQRLIEKRDKDINLMREVLLPLRVALARKPGASRYAMVQALNAELHRPLTQAERKAAGL